MKKIALLFCFLFINNVFAQIHCGFDFTSYLVVYPIDESNKLFIENLIITIIDENEKEVINTNNLYSWKDKDKPLVFSKNYKVSKENSPEKWFFPYAKESYLLSVNTSFPPDDFSIKIEDKLSLYKTQIIKLYAFNLYALCANENEKKIRTFGPQTNKPIEVFLTKIQ